MLSVVHVFWDDISGMEKLRMGVCMDIAGINEILSKYQEFKGNLISLLHEIQSRYNYLPEDELRYVSKRTGIPITRIYSIATFYHFFSLTPKGRHQLNVCLGTACHVKGSARVMSEVERQLGTKEAETTEDMRFTVNSVRCVGACSLAPVMTVDKDTYSGVGPKKVAEILRKYS